MRNVPRHECKWFFEDWNVTYQWGSTGLIGDSQLDEDFKGQAKGFPQQDPIQY